MGLSNDTNDPRHFRQEAQADSFGRSQQDEDSF